MFSARLIDPTSGRTLLIPPGMTLQPERWSAAAIGGPDDADVLVSGSLDLIEATLSGWLGVRVEIWNDVAAQRVWWGDVVEVTVSGSGMERGASLREMANRVRVRYQQRALGGGIVDDQFTDWIEHAASVARFGKWELTVTPAAPMTNSQADALRNATLANRALPVTTLRQVSGTPVQGRLVCAGYWHRLRRRYFSEPDGLVEYADGAAEWPVGCGFESNQMGFRGSSKSIHAIGGDFWLFQNGWRVQITGASQSANNRTYTVRQVVGERIQTLTSSGISFDPADDIRGSGLDFIDEGEMILVSGAAEGANNGKHYVKVAWEERIEISPGWSNVIADEAAGAEVTIAQGDHIVVEEVVTGERSNNYITCTVWGRKLYQIISLPTTGWTVNQVEIRVRKSLVGGTQDLTIKLVEDYNGTPDTTIDTQELYDDECPENEADWVAVQFENVELLRSDRTYGILLDETSDPDDFFLVGYDANGSQVGWQLRAYDGATWHDVDGVLQVRMLGGVDTAQQIGNIITAADVGLLADVTAASGLIETQYRDGSLLASDEAEALLAQGNSANQRMLAQVSGELVARVFAQPAATPRFMLRDDGNLMTMQGSPTAPGILPVAEWVALQRAVVESSSPFFVERAEYSVNNGLTLEPQNQRELWELTE